MHSSPVYNIALFGAGRIGTIHAHSIHNHPHTQMVYVVDPMESAANALAQRFGAKVASTSKVMSDETIDAILIGSATSTHADLIEAGIKANKAVFCEKPIDLSLTRVRQLLETIQNHQAPLLTGFNRRFDPAIMQMEKRIREDAIGQVELLTIISKDPALPPKDYLEHSGGLFRDMSIHDFDLARFLMKETFVSLNASASALVDFGAVQSLGDVDTAVITLKTKSGKLAVITNSRRACFGYDQRIEVHGEKGLLKTDNIAASNLVEANATGIHYEKPLHFFLERYAQSYQNEWAYFVNVLKGTVEARPNGDDGMQALMLAEAAIQSVQENRVIALSL